MTKSQKEHVEEKKEQPEQKKEPTPQEQIQELTNLLKEKQAEFENYQKRMAKQQAESIRFASESLIKQLLPIIDNFDLALKHADNAQQAMEGVKMIRGQIGEVLAGEGITVEATVGKPFDPRVAEPMKIVEAKEQEADKVVEEISPCYKLHGNVIRQAKVVVAKAAQPEKQN